MEDARNETKEKTVMEQSDSISKVTPYELATLASRIDPERCASAPEEAIAAAESLLSEAQNAIAVVEKRERKHEEEWTAHAKRLTDTHLDWVRGIKDITGENRRDRATMRFTQYMAQGASPKVKAEFSRYKRDGFTLADVNLLQFEFRHWRKQPKRKKGKQGRRISAYDGRLRTKLVGLVVTKPRKRV
jgi:hypothetical protein